jgi:6-phosphogluconolactonase
MTMNRRRFLVTLPMTMASAYAHAALPKLPSLRKKKPVVQGPALVYFGTDTSRGVSKGIYQARFDQGTGKLTQPALAAAVVRPAYLAVGTVRGGGKRILYAAAEGKDMDTSSVVSYGIDLKTGALAPMNRVSAGGVGPAYVSLDETGQCAFVADYAGGVVASFHILPDGRLSEPVERLDFHDTARFGVVGPKTARQDGPHPHSTTLSPDDRFLLVDDLGKDSIDVFPIDPAAAHLGDMELHRFTNNHPGSGPRHVVFHPNGRWVYGINELDNTVDRFLWQTTHRAGESQAVLVDTQNPAKLLDPGFTGTSTAAELAVSPDGYYLYASNRGEDTLVVFAIDQERGGLKLVQRISCGGKTPRHFTLSPNSEWVVCGNQDSATVTIFRRDGASGKLNGPVQTVGLDSPMFTLFV